ncbi:MAG: hypothetical protein ABI042_20060 [Verrucomicrobiota bacterium]
MKGKMKINIIRKLAVVTAMALTAVLVTFAPTTANAQKGAGAAALIGKPLDTVADIEALKPGDTVAMACPKCKTITISKVEEGKGSVKRNVTREQHQCPGCGNVIKTTGVGKAATDKVVHVCSKCGSELAFCCAMKKE